MSLPGEAIWGPSEAVLALRGLHIWPVRGDLALGHTKPLPKIGFQPQVRVRYWDGNVVDEFRVKHSMIRMGARLASSS